MELFTPPSKVSLLQERFPLDWYVPHSFVTPDELANLSGAAANPYECYGFGQGARYLDDYHLRA